MPRTQKRWLADQSMPDGQIFVSFKTVDVLSGSGAASTRSASGKFGLSLPTSATAYIIDKALDELIFRTGMNDDLQEAFGGQRTTFSSSDFPHAQGQASPPATFTTPAGVSGPPPFTGITELTPVTSARPKGIQINSVTCWYTIGAEAATTNTIAIFQSVGANNTATAVTTILAASALSTAVQTNPYLTTVSLTSPVMLTAQYAEISLEWDLTTGSGGTADIWGAWLGVSYNYQ